MNLIALPAFADNLIWTLHDGQHAVVVDPGDAAPVEAALDAQGLQLAAILVTHHHTHHVGGVDTLCSRLRGPVYGPARERIPLPFVPLAGGDRIEVLGLSFEAIDVPAHTTGHIAYIQRDVAAPPILFCADTMFSAGRGRLFEGTPAQMMASLAWADALPGDARLCCSHVYPLSDLRFAAAVKSDNAVIAVIAEYTQICRREREAGRPTLPPTLAREAEANPLLRCSGEPAGVSVARYPGARSGDGVEVFAARREWKNRHR
jgi:hydroxyacylglutathione hydrolase